MNKINLTLFQTTEKIPVPIKKIKHIELQEKVALLHFEKTTLHVQEDAETILRLANIKRL